MAFTTSIKGGLLKALERQPIERIHNLQYDFKILEATSSKHWQGELLGHQRRFPYFDLDETIRLPHCYPYILTLLKMTVVNKRKTLFAIVLRLLSSQTF